VAFPVNKITDIGQLAVAHEHQDPFPAYLARQGLVRYGTSLNRYHCG
jgi:hypothetical protein